MKFNVVTLFPDFFSSPLSSGLMGKAVDKGVFSIEVIDLREYSEDRFHRCDDYPYGGGAGMVLKPEPFFNYFALGGNDGFVIAPSAGGEKFSGSVVHELADMDEITLLCGHYEGIDERVNERYVDREISIGDYVLSGGEYAALVILDAVVRYLPGFMANSESLKEESYTGGLLEYPQYTRPAEIEGMKVPEVLLSGNHREIEKWRLEQRIKKTKRVRPDLYKEYITRKETGE